MPSRPSARPLGLRLELPRLEAAGLAPRRLQAFVPGGHSARPRPLLVLFDGQNVFDDQESYAGGWRAHLTAQRMPRRPDRAPVILAIDHGGAARINELTPWHDGQHGGQFEQLLQALLAAMTPELRERLGASARPEDTLIGGASLGGLAALYAHLQRPDVFGRCLAMSPSLWFARGRFFDWLERTDRPEKSRIYLDAGMREAPHMVHHARQLAVTLTQRGYHPATLRLHVDPRGHHREASWRRRLAGALRFLLKR